MSAAAAEGAGPLVRARSNSGALGPREMPASLPDCVRMVTDGERAFAGAIEEMTRVEVAARGARITRQRIRLSGLPHARTPADFDWPFRPTVPRARVEGLATPRLAERAESVVLVGGPGVGKTRLAVAIGIEAVGAGREVRLMECARPVEDLRDAQSRGILKKRPQYHGHSKLLVVDELGYLGIGKDGADPLLQSMSARYERRSVATTTNVGIGGWAKVLGDEVTASAIAGGVCHHCHPIRITGRSYRPRDPPTDRRRSARWPKAAHARRRPWRSHGGVPGEIVLV